MKHHVGKIAANKVTLHVTEAKTFSLVFYAIFLTKKVKTCQIQILFQREMLKNVSSTLFREEKKDFASTVKSIVGSSFSVAALSRHTDDRHMQTVI